MAWNCQGLGNPRTVRALRKLIANNKPDIIFLMETKLHNISPQFTNNFAASYSFYHVDCTLNGDKGRSGGLILLWNNYSCNVDIKDVDFNYIDMLVTNLSNSVQWRATGVYGYPKHQHKHLTCDLLTTLHNASANNKWLLFGDLNLTSSNNEKFGGNPPDNNITTLFRSTLTLCDLQDLGYKGDIFTWTNKQQSQHLIKARLDRFLANSAWKNLFPVFCNYHLLRYSSDHMPILLDFNTFSGPTTNERGPKPIRYEQIWTRDPLQYQIVKDAWQKNRGTTVKKLNDTLSSLHKWGTNRFGIIPKRIKTLQTELQVLNDQNGIEDLTLQIKEKEKELDNIMECEETWWKQRSRELWLKHGDKNTKYFHMKANIRRSKNKIEKITDSHGHTHTNDDGIEKVLVDHFKTLFTKQDAQAIPDTIRVVKDRINTDMYQELNRHFTKEEVFQAIKEMKALAAPGPDGLPAIFYHTHWEVIGKEVTDMVLNVLNNNGDPSHLNNTKTGHVGIKTDMEKAYDRVEWEFLEATMSIMGFPATMVQTIMKCVSTVKFSILIDGYPSQEFCPQRGLRQGDPLSPYLFIICANVLSGLISRAQQEKLIHGVKISQGAPEISHLLFADDSLIFCRATSKEVSTIHEIIQAYQKASGQLVNLAKSEMLFSKGVTADIKGEVSRILPMQTVEHFSKYLGMPIMHGRSKQQIFNYIKEKIWKKLKGWKEKNLSFAGRGTLIKAVAQAIPTYIMSCFLIPKGVCEQLERMICNFWWGSTTDLRKIHWMKWSKVCTQKKSGGLGFRNLRAFNEALLAKQGWRLITNPTSLVAQVLKEKYYPNEGFLNAKHKQMISYTWRSITQASWVLQKGCYWTIGSGHDINIWDDKWIQQKATSYKVNPRPNDLNLTKVKELMDNNYHEWNETIINQIFHPYDAQMILNIPIIDKTQPDTITWEGTQDGQYSVKSGYNAIMNWGSLSNATSSNNTQHIWSALWKLNVPPKHSHLLWRALKNALLVKGNLFKRGVRCEPLCPRCSNTTETINHVFLECEWAKQVWFASSLNLNLGLNQISEFFDWINFMKNNTDKECMEKITAITYGIWYARNMLVFQNKYLPPQDISSTALNQIQEYQLHGFEQQIQNPCVRTKGCNNDISWSPPPRGTLKINVDAHLSSDGHWLTGMVLRGSDGSAIGVATRAHKGTTDDYSDDPAFDGTS
ncbi:uncharacterized protein LOC123891638 [Trifolium pratense]|nr:uncharacterized protein LOC123891638 [Trifolium pratense]